MKQSWKTRFSFLLMANLAWTFPTKASDPFANGDRITQLSQSPSFFNVGTLFAWTPQEEQITCPGLLVGPLAVLTSAFCAQRLQNLPAVFFSSGEEDVTVLAEDIPISQFTFDHALNPLAALAHIATCINLPAFPIDLNQPLPVFNQTVFSIIEGKEGQRGLYAGTLSATGENNGVLVTTSLGLADTIPLETQQHSGTPLFSLEEKEGSLTAHFLGIFTGPEGHEASWTPLQALLPLLTTPLPHIKTLASQKPGPWLQADTWSGLAQGESAGFGSHFLIDHAVKISGSVKFYSATLQMPKSALTILKNSKTEICALDGKAGTIDIQGHLKAQTLFVGPETTLSGSGTLEMTGNTRLNVAGHMHVPSAIFLSKIQPLNFPDKVSTQMGTSLQVDGHTYFAPDSALLIPISDQGSTAFYSTESIYLSGNMTLNLASTTPVQFDEGNRWVVALSKTFQGEPSCLAELSKQVQFTTQSQPTALPTALAPEVVTLQGPQNVWYLVVQLVKTALADSTSPRQNEEL